MTQGLVDFLNVFQDVNKTFLMLLLVTVGVIFRCKGLLDGAQMVDFLKTTTISYFGTASVLNLTSVVRDHLATKLETLKGQNGNSDASKN